MRILLVSRFLRASETGKSWSLELRQVYPDGFVLFGSAQGVAVPDRGRDEMSYVFSAWRLGRICGGLADVLKESSQAHRRDEQVDGWIGRDIRWACGVPGGTSM